MVCRWCMAPFARCLRVRTPRLPWVVVPSNFDITIAGANATMTYDAPTDRFIFNKGIKADSSTFTTINASTLVTSSVARAPSEIELFMNGTHLAAGRNEFGNANLESERSNNLDFSVSYENNGYFVKYLLILLCWDTC